MISGKWQCGCVKSFESGQERFEDGRFVYWPHRIGKTVLLYGKRSSQFPFQAVVGPDWPCMLITYSLIIVPTVLFLIRVAYVLHISVVVLGSLSGLTLLIVFSLTACSDPGVIFIIPQSPSTPEILPSIDPSCNDNLEHDIEDGGHQQEPRSNVASSISSADTDLLPNKITNEINENIDDDEEEQRKKSIHNQINSPQSIHLSNNNINNNTDHHDYIECSICQIDRPRTAHHCYDCGVCVDELDHHCPWTGKCIGKKNMRMFQCFLAILGFHICFVLGSFAYALSSSTDVWNSN